MNTSVECLIFLGSLQLSKEGLPKKLMVFWHDYNLLRRVGAEGKRYVAGKTLATACLESGEAAERKKGNLVGRSYKNPWGYIMVA